MEAASAGGRAKRDSAALSASVALRRGRAGEAGGAVSCDSTPGMLLPTGCAAPAGMGGTMLRAMFRRALGDGAVGTCNLGEEGVSSRGGVQGRWAGSSTWGLGSPAGRSGSGEQTACALPHAISRACAAATRLESAAGTAGVPGDCKALARCTRDGGAVTVAQGRGGELRCADPGFGCGVGAPARLRLAGSRLGLSRWVGVSAAAFVGCVQAIHRCPGRKWAVHRAAVTSGEGDACAPRALVVWPCSMASCSARRHALGCG